ADMVALPRRVEVIDDGAVADSEFVRYGPVFHSAPGQHGTLALAAVEHGPGGYPARCAVRNPARSLETESTNELRDQEGMVDVDIIPWIAERAGTASLADHAARNGDAFAQTLARRSVKDLAVRAGKIDELRQLRPAEA